MPGEDHTREVQELKTLSSESTTQQEQALQESLKLDQSNPEFLKYWARRQKEWLETAQSRKAAKDAALAYLKDYGGQTPTFGAPSAEIVGYLEELRLCFGVIHYVIRAGHIDLQLRSGGSLSPPSDDYFEIDSRAGTKQKTLFGHSSTQTEDRARFESLLEMVEAEVKRQYAEHAQSTLSMPDMAHSGDASHKGGVCEYYRIKGLDYEALSEESEVVWLQMLITEDGIQTVRTRSGLRPSQIECFTLKSKQPKRKNSPDICVAVAKRIICEVVWADYLKRGMTYTPSGMIRYGKRVRDELRHKLLLEMAVARKHAFAVGAEKHAKDFSPEFVRRQLDSRISEKTGHIRDQLEVWGDKLKKLRKLLGKIAALRQKEQDLIGSAWGEKGKKKLRAVVTQAQGHLKELIGLLSTAARAAVLLTGSPSPADAALEEATAVRIAEKDADAWAAFSALRRRAQLAAENEIEELELVLAIGEGTSEAWAAQKQRWHDLVKELQKTIRNVNSIQFYVDHLPGAYGAMLAIANTVFDSWQQRTGEPALFYQTRPGEVSVTLGVDIGAKVGWDLDKLAGISQGVKATAVAQLGLFALFVGTLSHGDDRRFRFDGTFTVGLRGKATVECGLEIPQAMKTGASLELKAGFELAESALKSKVAAGFQWGLFKWGGSHIYEDQHHLAASWARSVVRAILFLKSGTDVLTFKDKAKRTRSVGLDELRAEERELLKEIASGTKAAEVLSYLEDRELLTTRLKHSHQDPVGMFHAKFVKQLTYKENLHNVEQQLRYLKEIRREFKVVEVKKWVGERTDARVIDERWEQRDRSIGKLDLPKALKKLPDSWGASKTRTIKGKLASPLVKLFNLADAPPSADRAWHLRLNDPNVERNGLFLSVMVGKLRTEPLYGSGMEGDMFNEGDMCVGQSFTTKLLGTATDPVGDPAHDLGRFAVEGSNCIPVTEGYRAEFLEVIRDFEEGSGTAVDGFVVPSFAEILNGAFEKEVAKREGKRRPPPIFIPDTFADKTAVKTCLGVWNQRLDWALRAYKNHFLASQRHGLVEIGLIFSPLVKRWVLQFFRIWRKKGMDGAFDVGKFTGVPGLMIEISGSVEQNRCIVEVLGADTFSYLRLVHHGLTRRVKGREFWSSFWKGHEERIVELLTRAGETGSCAAEELDADPGRPLALKSHCAALQMGRGMPEAGLSLLEDWLEACQRRNLARDEAGWQARSYSGSKAVKEERRRKRDALNLAEEPELHLPDDAALEIVADGLAELGAEAVDE